MLIIQKNGVIMLKKRELLGSTTVSNSYAITIIKNVKQAIGAKSGDEIGFFQVPDSKKIIILAKQVSGKYLILGSHKMSSQNTVTIPEKARDLLLLKRGGKLAYWQEEDSIVSIEN